MVVYESPDPANVYCYTPGIARLAGGRLVATTDLGGPGVAALPGIKCLRGEGDRIWQGKVFTSDDGGRSWTFRTDFPFMHARPFTAGGALYVLGHAQDLMIMRSDDGGATWAPAVRLTEGQSWHQSACNVHYARGCVYLAMERRTRFESRVHPVAELAPVLMRGREDADLTRRENWTFASELPWYEAVREDALDWHGIPFYRTNPLRNAHRCPDPEAAPVGWFETNVVQFADPDHLWHDPAGRTFHLWMRTNTGLTGYAAIAKVVETEDGAMATMIERAPSGRRMLFVPCPGGQMRFHVLFDAQTRLYWLLGTQATDSMRRPDRLPTDRFGLPYDQRRRLVLHFSTNMMDWCFAGLAAVGPGEGCARHYASMAVDGDDLCILSRSGDERARSAHDGNLITFHRVAKFRDLAY